MSWPENIILVGFSGTGKTAVGRELARLLEWELVDTDSEVERLAGKPIPQIFQEDGEPCFRALETQVLHQACDRQGRVVATGGGAVVEPENCGLMLKRGLVVCLDAAPETIHRRLMNGQDGSAEPRPMLSGPEPLKQIQELKASRHVYYSSAHRTVNTDNLTVEQSAWEIVRAYSEQIRRGRPQVCRE